MRDKIHTLLTKHCNDIDTTAVKALNLAGIMDIQTIRILYIMSAMKVIMSNKKMQEKQNVIAS